MFIEAKIDKDAIQFLAHIKNNDVFICVLTLITNEYGITTGDCVSDLDLERMNGLHVHLAINNDPNDGKRKILKHIYYPVINNWYTANIGLLKVRKLSKISLSNLM